MNWEQLPTYIMSIAALIGAYIAWRRSRSENKNLDTDIASKYEEMLTKEQTRSMTLQQKVSQLNDKVDELEEKLDELEKLVEQYSAGIDLLIQQLKANGITPIWNPKKRN